jgi:hypothetical protein
MNAKNLIHEYDDTLHTNENHITYNSYFPTPAETIIISEINWNFTDVSEICIYL